MRSISFINPLRRLLLVSSFAIFTSLCVAKSYTISNNSDVVGEVEWVTPGYEETFADIARKHHVAYDMLKQANPGVDPWFPAKHGQIKLPAQFVLPNLPRKGIVINLAERRLYAYFDEGRQVFTAPVGIGESAWPTPELQTKITKKVKDPVWRVPKSIQYEHFEMTGQKMNDVVEAGPNNPLGAYAMRMGYSGYLIHGTNRPDGVGRKVSHGCIRMYADDIATLFSIVKEGTPVHVVYQSFKAGQQNGQIVLQASPVADLDFVTHEDIFEQLQNQVRQHIDANLLDKVNWQKTKAVAIEANAIPQVISW